MCYSQQKTRTKSQSDTHHRHKRHHTDVKELNWHEARTHTITPDSKWCTSMPNMNVEHVLWLNPCVILQSNPLYTLQFIIILAKSHFTRWIRLVFNATCDAATTARCGRNDAIFILFDERTHRRARVFRECVSQKTMTRCWWMEKFICSAFRAPILIRCICCCLRRARRKMKWFSAFRVFMWAQRRLCGAFSAIAYCTTSSYCSKFKQLGYG